MFGFLNKKLELPDAGSALAGRAEPIPTAQNHFINGNPLKGPYPDGFETAYFALGCYWGAERKFWSMDGVWVTAVGNIAGISANPTYQEVCSGQTGHAEAVMVVYDPKVVDYAELLKMYWESHDPTQGMRQGNDTGTQYRSGVYWTSDAQRHAAEASLIAYQSALSSRGLGEITTEMLPAPEFFFAEDVHQQYLAKNPSGYCGLGGTGVVCPIGVGVDA